MKRCSIASCLILFAIGNAPSVEAASQHQSFYGCWERIVEFKWDGKVPPSLPPKRKPFPWRLGYCFSAEGKFTGYDFEGGWVPHGMDLGGKWSLRGNRLIIIRDEYTDRCHFAFKAEPKALLLSDCAHAGEWFWQRALNSEWGE